MSKFDSMTLDEVKRYFLKHREDTTAFSAYMDKLQESGRAIVIDPSDPTSEERAIAQMQERLGLNRN